MVSANTPIKNIFDVKGTVVAGCETFADKDDVKHLRIQVYPDKRHECRCPKCGKKCPHYDSQGEYNKLRRAPDWGGIIVEIEAPTYRICCPEHKVVTADVPRAYPGSSFTKSFDLEAAWLATYLPRSTVSKYLRIDWETVGRCITRALNDLEPDRSRRLDDLVDIGIDETSYKKSQKYITVVVNHDTNTVVWVSEGHGKSVLEHFYRSLTPEQLASIKVVTGDGARWITECVEEFTPNCERCVDPFHVVQWAMEALDEVRRDIWRDAYSEAQELAKEVPKSLGRPEKDDAAAAIARAAKEKADEIKNSAYYTALGLFVRVLFLFISNSHHRHEQTVEIFWENVL